MLINIGHTNLAQLFKYSLGDDRYVCLLISNVSQEEYCCMMFTIVIIMKLPCYNSLQKFLQIANRPQPLY